ncbi:uncharacterized protein EDB91DRAFT_1334885 [Suillus paluster]|uniref:uncharacterized protein n=1 Tax=Suillus paluster TaxID=48578 RepID=UPI001B87AEE0|nr:uncharacterized protein EDB91DRAFT_1334885 [Suillus paluster]KAG1747136.1 hypothetical protein EDB91DRAFT_1334885 [Suillus paluster]
MDVGILYVVWTEAQGQHDLGLSSPPQDSLFNFCPIVLCLSYILYFSYRFLMDLILRSRTLFS